MSADRVGGSRKGSTQSENKLVLPSNVDSGASKTAGSPFVCQVCHRSYGRIDHLARHFRSHTNEKPFKCEECGKTFARTDLLKRHISLHNPTDKNGGKRRLRASQACAACAAVKVKCDTNKPCGRCVSRGLICRIELSRSASSTRATTLLVDGEADAAYEDDPQQSLTPTESESQSQWISQSYPSAPSDASMLDTGDNALTKLLRDVVTTAPEEFQANTAPQPLLPPSYDLVNQPCPPHPRDLMDFSTDRGMDFSALDDMMSTDWESWLDPLLAPQSDQGSSEMEQLPDAPTPPMDESLNMSSAAFERSSWRWDPRTQPSGLASAPNLATTLSAEEAQDGISHDPPLNISPRFQLTPQNREQMISLLLPFCHKSNLETITALFPAPRFLSSFLSDTCLMIDSSLDSWIHLPTFNIADCRPGLLNLLVAYGAVNSRSSFAQKFGYALHETSGPTVRFMFESDNKTSRVLQPLQTLAMYLKIGTFSGNKRTTEIAEGGSLPIVTMLRRAGRFRRSHTSTPDPRVDDSPQVLDEKWRAWILAESFKRIAYYVFIYSVQLSIAFQIPPLISYTEMSLALPAPRALWRAETAAQWREHFFAYRQHESLPPFLSVVSHPDVLGAARDRIDMDLSCYLVLLAHWSFAWEFLQLSSANKSQTILGTEWAGTLLASSKRQEIHTLLNTWRQAADGWGYIKPKEVQMMVPLLFMNLFVGFQDLQLLAGKEGPEEARHIYGPLKQWFHTPECRQALWYAGQVLRAARSSPLRCIDPALAPTANTLWLRDFHAVELYHAALVFWVYGVLSRAVSMEQALPNTAPDSMPSGAASPYIDHHGDHVFLDADDEAVTAMQRHDFIGLNKGLAVLSTSSPSTDDYFAAVNAPQTVISPSSLSSDLNVVPVHDTRRVMDVVISVLALDTHDESLAAQRSSHLPEPRRPALVDNLIQLLRDLGEAASNF